MSAFFILIWICEMLMRVAVVIFEMARKSFFVNVGEEYITSHKNAAPLFWKMRLFLGC
jgi:hypothetical protein